MQCQIHGIEKAGDPSPAVHVENYLWSDFEKHTGLEPAFLRICYWGCTRRCRAPHVHASIGDAAKTPLPHTDYEDVPPPLPAACAS